MPRFRITTPEQVAFHYDTAGLISRALAWMIDQFFIMAGRVAVVVSLSCGGVSVGGMGQGLVIALVLLGFFVLDFGYFTLFELRWAGQSPGKRVMGLRVIPLQGGRLRFPEVLMRNLVRSIDALPLGMVVGGLVALMHPLHRRLGDLAADTLVVRSAAASLPAEILAQHRGRVNTFADDAVLRNRILARVTRAQRDLILDLALRRDDLDPVAREDLFARAAAYFRQRFALPSDLDYLSDEQTVLNLALVLQSTTLTGAPAVAVAPAPGAAAPAGAPPAPPR